MSHFEAVNQHVRLSLQPSATATLQSWLDLVQTLHADMARRHGVLPDSAMDIAADRLR